MNFHAAQLAHEANLQDQYDRTQETNNDFRDYVLISCTHDEGEGPALVDYFAFHDGDDCDIRSCVPIGHKYEGKWLWGFVGNDFDERKAAEVHRMPGLLSHEVQREFRSWLEKRDTLKNELIDARAYLHQFQADCVVRRALEEYAARKRIELNELTKEAA